MEEALYSDLGFFNTDQVRSDKEGDFLTSPEVSKYFGKIIRNWINSESNLKNIIEIGSGTGSLICLLYTSPSPRDGLLSRMPSSA